MFGIQMVLTCSVVEWFRFRMASEYPMIVCWNSDDHLNTKQICWYSNGKKWLPICWGEFGFWVLGIQILIVFGGLKNVVQWGSEYKTCRVFEWSKHL
jgi:hypothetical protein